MSYKNELPPTRASGTHGLTMMCDSSTIPNKQSIINFLIDYNMKIFFYKSVDAYCQAYDMDYILRLIEEMID